jgi:predicted AAA+ superfamily ATPase
MPYIQRLVDRELDELLPELPAIAIDGPKGVGKTETLRRRAATTVALDTIAQGELCRAHPERIRELTGPVLIDEWQLAPATWDVVRRSVDDGARPGSYLLAGSATPLADTPAHSGAGRIASIRMRPLSLPERQVSTPTVSLEALMRGGAPVAGDCALTLSDYAREIVSTGLPGIHPLAGRARRAQLDDYLGRALRRPFPDETGLPEPRAASLRGWLQAYAAATGSTASYEAIRDAATAGTAEPPAKSTAIRYRDWLSALWLLDPVPAWRAPGSPLRRLTAGPKHHLADPGLAAHALDVDADDLLDGAGRVAPGHGTLLGALFESLSTLTVRCLAQTLEARTSHLRTQRGEHEVDLIVEGRGGRVVAAEVKLGAGIVDADVRHLHWLRDQLGDRVKDLVVLTTGPAAYRRPDGVAVVPLGLLGL